MVSALVQKLTGVRDLKKILETTVKDLGESFQAETCQIMLSNPLDPNVTSICEFRASKDEAMEVLPTVSVPLVLHGRTVGSLSLARYKDVSLDEVNTMRVILGELSEIIRGAQINDIVQRDTFRDTFLVEIGNVMAYSLGIGDALFMVVNILGKVLQASRCLFICTDDSQAGWKCYEFWQQEKVQSCQDYRWPTSDSAVIAQTLLTRAPIKVYEGQQNSYVSRLQEELQFIGTKSLLGVPLRSKDATHGCVILQQCDYRRAWTRGEIDMVQNVADKVAEALLKLPAEKRAREPIMQLHQRIVEQPDQAKAPDAVTIRNVLKGILGQQAIPSARKTSSQPVPAPAPKPPAPKDMPVVPPPSPVAPAAATPPSPAPAAAAAAAPNTVTSMAPNAAPAVAAQPAIAAQPAVAAQAGASGKPINPFSSQIGNPTISPVQAKSGAGTTAPPPAPQPATNFASAGSGSAKSLGSILGASARAVAPGSVEMPPPPPPAAPKQSHTATGDLHETIQDPYADLDFGDIAEIPVSNKAPTKKTRAKSNDPDSTWGNLEALKQGAQRDQSDTIPPSSVAVPSPLIPSAGATGEAPAAVAAGSAGAAAESPAAAAAESPAVELAAAAAESAAAPTSQAAAAKQAEISSKWGDLDSIPTPKASEKPAAPEAAPASDSAPAPNAAPSKWGDLDSIPGPKAAPAAAASAWGDLDAIPAPKNAPSAGGLSGMMTGKARASSTPASKPFLKSRGVAPPAPEPSAPAPSAPPEPPLDDAAVEAKLKEKLAAKNAADELSDYIFATPGFDPRTAGRISSWIQEIEEKDRYNAGHCKPVAEYAVAIAREAGLSEENINLVRQAALLHDVGKRACAPQILQKKDEDLSDAELIIMMKHPIDGAELLESFPDLKQLAPIVRAHHEEFDGNGYPQGLRGDEIPVAARIIAVANSYHSLTSEMKYGPGMNAQKAQEELVKGAGKQWDPNFVQALIQAIMANKVPGSM